MRRLLAWLSIAWFLGGCAGGGRYWQEEIALPDGQSIVVERIAILGNPLNRELPYVGHAPPVIGHRIVIPTRAGTTLRWEGDESLVPLVVYLEGGSAFIVARPSTCPAYDRWNRPIPPYVVFRNDGDGWRRGSLDQIPTSVSKSNLLVDTASKQAVEQIERGRVDKETIEKRNREVGLASQTIYRTVTKEVRMSYGTCEGFQEAARDLPR